MKELVAIVICLVVGHLAAPLEEADAGGLKKPGGDTRLLFGDQTSLDNPGQSPLHAPGTGKVLFHMEPDLYIPGNILFSHGSELKTTNEADKPKNIVGSMENEGYVEGTGSNARFRLITGFVQISKDKVVLVDKGNHCLRLLDRVTNTTSHYAGRCEVRGRANGAPDRAELFNPHGVIINKRNKDELLVFGDGRGTIRVVGLDDQHVGTVIDDEKLIRPRSGVFDRYDNNILYVTAMRAIVKVTLSPKKSVTVLTGANEKKVYKDGKYEDARFGFYLGDIIYIDDNHLAVADLHGHDVRILDLVDNKVTSLCVSRDNGTVLSTSGCKMDNPHSLMMLNGTLYVGDKSQIHMFPVTSIPQKGAEFQVEYTLDCATMTDPVTSSVIETAIEDNFADLQEICKGVCERKPDSKPTTNCSNGVLTVMYTTDLTYAGDMMVDDVRKTLTSRLTQKGAMMSVPDISQSPPVIFPIKQADGSSAKLILA